MSQRVVITGLGIVSPMGDAVEIVWQGMMTGKNGFNKTTIFDATTFPSTFCAEVKNYDFGKFVKNTELHKHGNRGTKFVLGATVQACKQAKIDIETDTPKDGIDRTRLGIYLGAGEGSIDTENFFEAIIAGYDSENAKMDYAKWTEIASAKLSPQHELEQEPNMPISHIALLAGVRGPTRSCLTACAASTQSVGEAYKIIQRGDADIIIAGGAHSMIHPLGITGFNRLTALSTNNDNWQTASRPFSATRDGFVIGEGGAIVILETIESAKKRGVEIFGEIIGFGSTNDAFRVTDMHEDARGAVNAIKAAIKDAKITKEQVQYINAHGTSTSENDSIETRAIKTVFGDYAKNVPVSSVKGMLGHLIGAAGCAELITCVMALRDNTLPPTMNYSEPDPELDLDYVPNKPRKVENLEIVMNESFGFGGQNNVIIVRKFKD